MTIPSKTTAELPQSLSLLKSKEAFFLGSRNYVEESTFIRVWAINTSFKDSVDQAFCL